MIISLNLSTNLAYVIISFIEEEMEGQREGVSCSQGEKKTVLFEAARLGHLRCPATVTILSQAHGLEI